MIDPVAYLTFLAAFVALILVPGPAQALVLASTLSGGKRAGVITALGLNVGTLLHASAVACGVSAILATSAVAFTTVKYAGAAYLVYLGVRAIRTRVMTPNLGLQIAGSSNRALLTQAVAAGTLNPKVAMFFLAFLPQFVDPERGAVLLQFLVLGATMAALDVLYEVGLVHVVSGARRGLLGSARFATLHGRVSGGILIALGLRLAAQQRG